LGEKLQPELVSPLVTYLCHESCESTGRTYSVGGGRVAEVFIGECQGYTSDELTPESLRDNWDTVTDRAGYEVPSQIAEETAMFLKALG
ncbi:MAG: short-chain dehydrogenase, partial [Ilumatobacter sp.]